MELGLDVLVVGHSADTIADAERALAGVTGLQVERQVLREFQSDPLESRPTQPDAMVYCVGEEWQETLQALGSRPAAERPPVIVVARNNDTAVMRAAMRAGARDFFVHPVSRQEIAEVFQQLSFDKHVGRSSDRARLTAVIGARGGAGTSMVSSNLAHILTQGFGLRTALMDLDIQFGALPLYYDMQPSDGLLEAIARIDSLDEVAIEGYMLKHESGVHILGSAPDQLLNPGEVDDGALTRLLTVIKRAYQQVVIDLPRQIDNVAGTVTSAADRVVVVVQPNIPHIKDTRQLLELLTGMMGVPEEKILVVANRCDRQSAIDKGDLERIFGRDRLVCVANDFPTVSESQNIGRPLMEVARKAAVTRDLIALSERVSGRTLEERRGTRRLFGFKLG